MNKLQTVYVPVKIEDIPTNDENSYIVFFGSDDRIGLDYKPFDSGVTHYLQPTQAILITQEERDAISNVLNEARDALVMNTLLDRSSVTKDALKLVEQLLTQLNNQLWAG